MFHANHVGPYIGYYSNTASSTVFIVETDAIDFADESTLKSYSQAKYEFIAFRTTEQKMMAYDCSFDVNRFRAPEAIKLARSRYPGPADVKRYQIILEISKFLSEEGVDLEINNCKENPEYLQDGAKSFKKVGD